MLTDQVPTPTPTPTPTIPVPSAGPSGITVIDFSTALTYGLLLAGGIAATVLLIGILLLIGRKWLAHGAKEQPGDSGPSLVRSWIAVSLVAGLLIFSAIGLFIADTNLRNVLLGGLIANVGAAVAFYFSSQDANQARRDILSAALGFTDVPDLGGQTVQKAKDLISQTSLKLEVPANAADTATVKTQTPDKGTSVRNGSTVTITVG